MSYLVESIRLERATRQQGMVRGSTLCLCSGTPPSVLSLPGSQSELASIPIGAAAGNIVNIGSFQLLTADLPVAVASTSGVITHAVFIKGGVAVAQYNIPSEMSLTTAAGTLQVFAGCEVKLNSILFIDPSSMVPPVSGPAPGPTPPPTPPPSGPVYVFNAQFDVNAGGFVGNSGTHVSIVNGAMQVRNDVLGSGSCSVQIPNLVVGDSYVAKFMGKNGGSSAALPSIFLGAPSPGQFNQYADNVPGSKTVVTSIPFTAQYSTLLIYATIGESSVGATQLYEFITVEKA